MRQNSITKNVVFNAIYRTINMLFPLVTSIYTSRILLASGVGKVGVAQNIVQYFVLLAPLGIVNYGTREIAKNRDDKISCNKVFTQLFFINFISTFICVLVYYLMILSCAYFSAEQPLYLIAGLPNIFNFINVEWYYQGNEDYVYISIRSLVIKILSLIAIFLFVRDRDDYVRYALIYALGIAGNYVLNILNLTKRGVKLDFSDYRVFVHLKPVIILLFSNIAIELYTLLDTTMLGYLCNDEVVGYYTNSIKLVKTIIMLITAMGAVLLPRLTYYKEKGLLVECSRLTSKVIQILLFLAMPSMFGIFILAEIIVEVFFGNSFMPAIGVMRMASTLICLISFSNLFGTQVLITFGQEKKLLLCTSIGAITNVSMNYLLIPNYQHNGAIIASVISECLVTIMTAAFSRAYIKINVSVKYFIQVFVATIMMSMIVLYVSSHINYKTLSLFASVSMGIVSYLIIGMCLNNPIIKEGIGIFKRYVERKK